MQGGRVCRGGVIATVDLTLTFTLSLTLTLTLTQVVHKSVNGLNIGLLNYHYSSELVYHTMSL